MKNRQQIIVFLIQRLFKAVWRFPLTVLCLAGVTALIWYMISLDASPSLVIEKLMYTLVVGALIGIVIQFSIERFEKVSQKRLIAYIIAVLFTAGYCLILLPVPEISAEIIVRTIVAVFAMFCAVLWIPGFKDRTDFNEVALIHFKAVFTSILYSGVLSAGVVAIIVAIDTLLFNVNDKVYLYSLSFIWVMFATLYYLSLLPKFNSQDDYYLEAIVRAKSYPKFLEILVSYITIPIIAVYTLVLLAYFIKILITLHWPSGQLGPMVLVYSAAGIIIFVLASLLQNRFAYWYRMIFPKVLIPIVVIQLISVGIRLNAYGITESRYYVALFGIFSIVSGVLLSIKPVGKNSLVALLAAAFAIFSIIPPVDAFTVSRFSQITRVEKMLQDEGVLVNGKLKIKDNVSEHTKIEVTNILVYLDKHSSLKYIKWLPEDFNVYRDMEQVLGFKPTYKIYNETDYFYAALDTEKPINISGYDVYFNISYMDTKSGYFIPFNLEGVEYKLAVDRLSNKEIKITVKDISDNELVSAQLYEFAKKIVKKENEAKNFLTPEEMTLDVVNNEYKLRVIFQNINMAFAKDENLNAEYSFLILFSDNNINY